MQTITEVYNGDDLKFTQEEKNVIVWAIRMVIRAAVSQDERKRADALKAILDKMSAAGWEYPSDYCSENYQ